MYASRWRTGTGKFDPNSVFNVTAYMNETALDWYEYAPMQVTGRWFGSPGENEKEK